MAANTLDSEVAPQIQHLDTDDRAFAVKWTDGHESVFHYVWLRFNCACELCGDLDSGIGRVAMADIPADVSPREVCVDDAGRLNVVWGYDGHESWFEPRWLRAYCYSDTARLARRHRPKLWNSSSANELLVFDYQQVVEDEGVRLEAFEHLRDYGYSRFRGAPLSLEVLQGFAGLFGHIMTSDSLGPYSDMVTKEKKEFITDVPAAIPLHTDQCYRHTPVGINFSIVSKQAARAEKASSAMRSRLRACYARRNPKHSSCCRRCRCSSIDTLRGRQPTSLRPVSFPWTISVK